MLREITLIASTVGGRFNGQAINAADALGIRVLRRPADRLVAAYVPARAAGAFATLLLAPTIPAERYVTLALAHHLLRHRSAPLYPYDADGPLYGSSREWWEAQVFAHRFQDQGRPNLVAFRGNRRRHA